MRYTDLFISGLGNFLPKPLSVDEAIAAGSFEAEEQEETGQQSVSVAGPENTQPDMAVRAGRTALERSSTPAEEVNLLLHAVTSHNGLEGWNAASYLQNQLLSGGSALSLEIRQLSNGAMAGVDLAASYLAGAPSRRAALITSADVFGEPSYNRWRTSWGLVFADGASAAVLSRHSGFSRILSCVTVSAPELEGMHRGSLPFTPAPDPGEYPLDFRSRILEFAQSADLEQTSHRMAERIRTAVSLAAEDAGIRPGDADHYVVPGFGRALLHRECLAPLDIPISRTTFGWHTRIGHLGAADQFASLTHLSEAGRLAPGQKVLLIGVGGGFNWTCTVLDIVYSPPWAY